LLQSKGKTLRYGTQSKGKTLQMPKHIKNGKTFRLYADTYKNQ